MAVALAGPAAAGMTEGTFVEQDGGKLPGAIHARQIASHESLTTIYSVTINASAPISGRSPSKLSAALSRARGGSGDESKRPCPRGHCGTRISGRAYQTPTGGPALANKSQVAPRVRKNITGRALLAAAYQN